MIRKLQNILTTPSKLIRKPISEIDEDKILFYDWETDHQYAPYASIKSCAVQYGFSGVVEMVDRPSRRKEFKRKLAAPDIIKVDFNGVNFDRTVGYRHGYFVHPQNAHDVYQILKTISPTLPAFSQKFAAFYFPRRSSDLEMELFEYMSAHGCAMHEVPTKLLHRYNAHDIVQLEQLFRMSWDVVIRNEFWEAYLNDALIYEPSLEMHTEGGIYIDIPETWRGLQRLQKTVQNETKRALELTHGEVQNPNSSKQLARYFTEFDNLELELTASGEFSVKKSVLVSLKDENPLAECAFNIRDANGSIKYLENYLNATDDETYHEDMGPNWIPIQYSWSSARTRRTTSQSFHKINFQNPNDRAKAVQIVPEGQLGWWFDSTQVENIVHIYESNDTARRASYEGNYDWNEYVWLCNIIYGEDKDKDYWDDKENMLSPRIPTWTVYKETKTGKLAINFGMGVTKFCKLFGLNRDVGEEVFGNVHSACPAIRELQNRVASDLRSTGYVTDVFGKRYAGSPSQAYKVVAYLIQGCGTGSLPKAQIRANWETLRRMDKKMPTPLRRRAVKSGVMCTTTHDENGGRIDLRLGSDNILHLLQKLNFNMTERFSEKFDNIPLRAKLYLSKTTAKNAIEVDINDHESILRIIKGDPCPCCKATGHVDKTKCLACEGLGYIHHDPHTISRSQHAIRTPARNERESSSDRLLLSRHR
jgi:hypothetical protein